MVHSFNKFSLIHYLHTINPFIQHFLSLIKVKFHAIISLETMEDQTTQSFEKINLVSGGDVPVKIMTIGFPWDSPVKHRATTQAD